MIELEKAKYIRAQASSMMCCGPDMAIALECVVDDLIKVIEKQKRHIARLEDELKERGENEIVIKLAV